jgi:carboxylesterase
MLKKNDLKKISQSISLSIKREKYNDDDKPSFRKGNEVGVLVIPGFDNTAYIMKEYSDHLIDAGFSVYTINLPGMESTFKGFGKVTWNEWVAAAKEDYFLLKNITKRTIIAGFSTGASIALYLLLALGKKDLPDGIILMSPALFFVNRFIPVSLGLFFMRIYRKIDPYPKKLKNSEKIFLDPKARKKYYKPGRTSINAVCQVLELVRVIRKRTKIISVPFLVIQSSKDIVVHKHGAFWLMKKAGAKESEMLILKNSGHPVMVDMEKNKVFVRSIEFIKKLAINAPKPH